MDRKVTSGASLFFDEVSYKVKTQKGNKTLLHNISGFFPSGSLVCILGPSGAGKTTLMNILSGLNKNYEGSLYAISKSRQKVSVKQISYYVPFENHLQDLLTVEENMQFAAEFRLGKPRNKVERKQMILGILRKLGLEKSQHTMAKQLSGGEKKRLALSLALVDNPDILYLDEPTTGLDSVSSKQCIEFIKMVSAEGKTIVCTIHQPSSDLLRMFDIAYVLSRGRCIYNGQVEHLLPHLEDMGVPCHIYHNPADHIIEIASGEYGDNIIETLIAACKNGRSFGNMLESQEGVGKTVGTQAKIRQSVSLSRFICLCRREIVKTTRDQYTVHVKLFSSIFLGVIVGTSYWNIAENVSKIIFTYMMVLCCVAGTTVLSLCQSVLSVPFEMKIVENEHFNKYYLSSEYFFMKILTSFPITVTCNFILNSIIYYSAALPTDLERVAMFFTTLVLNGLITESLALSVGLLVRDVQTVVMACFVIFIPQLGFSGFGVVFSQLSPYLYWISYISFPSYVVCGQLKAIYGYNRKLKCEAEFCLYTSGTKFLNFLGVKKDQIFSDFGMLVIFYFIYTAIGYLGVLKRLGR